MTGASITAVFDFKGVDMMKKGGSKTSEFHPPYIHGKPLQTQQTSHNFLLGPHIILRDLGIRSLRGEYCYVP